MADKPVNSNHTLPPNIKIKVEPGTSMPVPLKNIKTEPGVAPSTTRLTSFRLPRDLTLGGNIKTEKPKKLYTPNLNVQRAKKKEDASSNKSDAAKATRGKDRGRGRGRGDRGRGRGSSNLIQSTGVWSEGIMKTPGVSARHSSPRIISERSALPKKCLERPKLDLNRSIDKADEEEKLKLLLRDDFIEDEDLLDLDYVPVTLPMLEDAKLYKDEPKPELEDEEEVDRKPIILENGEALEVKQGPKIKELKTKGHAKKKLPDTIPQIIENKSSSYTLIQFPDCLPGLECTEDDVRPHRSNDASHEKGNESKSKTQFCTLHNLKPGMLGKLQILKSGKARLLLGENNLIVDVGSHISFRQDLIAAKVDTVKLDGDLINLGPITNTFICSPDWESMLAKL